MQKLLLMYLLLCTSVVVQAQQSGKPKTQATNMVAINQPKEVDTTTSPTVRAMIQILRNKHKYIGQPFSVLLKDLPYSIRYFYPMLVSTDNSEKNTTLLVLMILIRC